MSGNNHRFKEEPCPITDVFITPAACISSRPLPLTGALAQRPFQLEAIIILPDHLHCLWQLPEGDADYSNRWKMLKGYVMRHTRDLNGPVWQPRFWEHLIRDEDDRQRHMDYIHFNPVKHGLTNDPATWPASSFKRFQERGVYPSGWGMIEPPNIAAMQLE